MPDTPTACLWPTGIHGSDDRCGKPAKAVALDTPYETRNHPQIDIPVCGIHARKARNYGYRTAEGAGRG